LTISVLVTIPFKFLLESRTGSPLILFLSIIYPASAKSNSSLMIMGFGVMTSLAINIALIKSIPVVDSEDRLMEVVAYDAILKIFHHEFREDNLKSGGIHHHIKEIEDITTPVSRLVRARVLSLILGLIGGLVAVYIVKGFENILSSYFVLASCIPVLIYLSDAIGTQSQTLIVRMIALEPAFSVKST
jgi:Mg/Co/Ni transporter MgtE